jgi:hypothetical protein
MTARQRAMPKLAAPAGVDVARATSCSGKFGFDSRDQANAIAHRGGRSREVYSGREPYRCGHCGRWHVGATPPAQRRAIRARSNLRRVPDVYDRSLDDDLDPEGGS